MTDQPKRIGRPPLPPEQRKDVHHVTTRITGKARAEKFRRLGREWLERKLDEEPDHGN